jgi:ankyrin repeat protein
MELLLSRVDINLNIQDESGLTPLHYAAQGITNQCMRLIMDRGADTNIQDKNGLVPLHYAIRWGTTNQCMALLNGGVDTNTQDEDGLAPLHYVFKWGRDADAEVLMALLAREDIDVNLKDSHGATPRDYAIQCGSEKLRATFTNVTGMSFQSNSKDNEDVVFSRSRT